MDRLKNTILYHLLSFVLLSIFFANSAQALQVFSVGKYVGDYKLTLLNGEEIDFADYLGKKCVIIEFWADYCGNCTKFMTALEEIRSSKAFPDVEYLGLVCEWGVSYERSQKYIERHGITFPQIWIPKKSGKFKKSGDAKKTGSFDYRLPKRVFIDKSGNVIVENRENISDPKLIKELLEKILDRCSGSADIMM